MIAYSRFDGRTAELEKLWVEPPFRRAGLAQGLLGAALDALRAESFERVVLESATFMASALRIYEAAGFVRRPPLRPALPSVRGVALTMERHLP